MPEIDLPNDISKSDAFDRISAYLRDLSLTVADIDDARPWGGFFVIDKRSESAFVNTFFAEQNQENIYKYGNDVMPKILLVAPEQKLSWQYHHRRAELWKAVAGPVGVLVSSDDTQPNQPLILQTGDVVEHAALVRHRLVGLTDWGIVAEIWQHTDPNQLSDESDIIRVEDNYGRD